MAIAAAEAYTGGMTRTGILAVLAASSLPALAHGQTFGCDPATCAPVPVITPYAPPAAAPVAPSVGDGMVPAGDTNMAPIQPLEQAAPLDQSAPMQPPDPPSADPAPSEPPAPDNR